ncbi:MAG: winged helix-turn-helix domain-containing protein [Chloroflexi bacterium]|nr:winged helix-turn-helix domain-containing protein [Chloroflexota bacterium]
MGLSVLDWDRFQELLDNARKILRVRYAVIAHYNPNLDVVRLVAFSARRTPGFDQAQALVTRIFPQFDILNTVFPPNANPLTTKTYLQGEVVEALVKDLSSNIVNPIILNFGITMAGFRHGLVCPIKLRGRIYGAAGFYGPKSLDERQREAGLLIAGQAAALWESMLEEQDSPIEKPEPPKSKPEPKSEPKPTRSAAVGSLRHGDLTLQARNREILAGDRPLDLRDREYELLVAFLIRPGKVLTREELRRIVWSDLATDRDSLDEVALTVRSVRRKLEAASAHSSIRVVRGNGYMLF